VHPDVLSGTVVGGVGVGLAGAAVGGTSVGGASVGGTAVGVGVAFDPQAERKKIKNTLVRNNFFISISFFGFCCTGPGFDV
jgi:hypothetical protein